MDYIWIFGISSFFLMAIILNMMFPDNMTEEEINRKEICDRLANIEKTLLKYMPNNPDTIKTKDTISSCPFAKNSFHCPFSEDINLLTDSPCPLAENPKFKPSCCPFSNDTNMFANSTCPFAKKTDTFILPYVRDYGKPLSPISKAKYRIHPYKKHSCIYRKKKSISKI